jgi:hypothetical protein
MAIYRFDLIVLWKFWVSKWLLFHAKSTIFRLYHSENKLICNEMIWGPLCTRPIRLVGFLVLDHWKNSPRIDISPYSDTLSWSRANQTLFVILNAVCLAENQQIPILRSLVWSDRGSNPQSTTLLHHRYG